MVEDSGQGRQEQAAEFEPRAAEIFAEVQQTEHRPKGATSGNDDVYRSTVVCANDNPSGDADGAGGAQSRVRGDDFQYCETLLGEPARSDERSGGEVALKCPPDGVSAARQRVPGGNGGR